MTCHGSEYEIFWIWKIEGAGMSDNVGNASESDLHNCPIQLVMLSNSA